MYKRSRIGKSVHFQLNATYFPLHTDRGVDSTQRCAVEGAMHSWAGVQYKADVGVPKLTPGMLFRAGG